MATFRENPAPEVITNYGALGPGADVTADKQPITPPVASWRLLAALAVGGLLALALLASGVLHSAWTQLLGSHEKAVAASPTVLTEDEISRINQDTPPRQALLLLQEAINHTDGATDQITAHLDGWHGKLRVDAQINQLLETALNSDDLKVRAAGIEIQLLTRHIDKDSETAEHWISQAQFGVTGQRTWALWILGLLGNRGIEQERVTQVLIAQLRDPDPDIRHWAVEGLSYVGTDQTIDPLLQTLQDDPSPMVRERAGCALAQCGMLTHQQRQTIVPKLIEFAEDASLDAQTHSNVYHALRDITAQSLLEDPAAWRKWYSSSNHS
jgi:HEAT repeat protein